MKQLNLYRGMLLGAWESPGEATSFVIRMGSDMLRSHYEINRSGCDVVRSQSITEVRASSGYENLAEMSGFYGADIFRRSDVSPEPVLFSRATQVMHHHFRGRDAVKSDLFSRKWALGPRFRRLYSL